MDVAVAQDDTDSARRILSSIDPDALKADADLALQAQILRNRIRFTESYLAATALAESGRYREARERMLALIPFRDAGVHARLYGVELAKELITQARTEAPVRPDHALALLEEAEDDRPVPLGDHRGPDRGLRRVTARPGHATLARTPPE